MRKRHKSKCINGKPSLSGKHNLKEWYHSGLDGKMKKPNAVQKSVPRSTDTLCLKQEAFQMAGRKLQLIYSVEKNEELRRNRFSE